MSAPVASEAAGKQIWRATGELALDPQHLLSVEFARSCHQLGPMRVREILPVTAHLARKLVYGSILLLQTEPNRYLGDAQTLTESVFRALKEGEQPPATAPGTRSVQVRQVRDHLARVLDLDRTNQSCQSSNAACWAYSSRATLRES